MSSAITFEATFDQFLEDLKGTFPEYAAALTLAGSLTDRQTRFLEVWRTLSIAVAAQDGSVFSATGLELVPGFKMTAALWAELSPRTQSVIWKYLSTLLLLSAVDNSEQEEGGLWDISGFQHSMEAMMAHLREAASAAGPAGGAGDAEGATSAAAGLFGGLFEKLGKIAERFGGATDVSGAAAPDFKIPERLMKGTIAKIVEEIVHEFKPEDFGITPEMMETKDPRAMFEYLQEIFTKKPDLLMSAGKKIAKKLQAKFASGSIKRDDIIAEVEELMKEFSGNSAFSELFGNLGEMLRSSEKESGNEGSARRREVQDRLRKKAAEKAAKKAAGSVGAVFGGGSALSNSVVSGAELEAAEMAAAAAANALLLEEAASAATKSSKAAKKK